VTESEWQQALSEVTSQPILFDQNGLAGIVVNADLPLYIGFLLQDERVTAFSPLGPAGDPVLLQALLQANHLWKGTNGATLSLYDGNQAMIAMRVDSESAPGVDARYETFLSAAMAWRQRLAA